MYLCEDEGAFRFGWFLNPDQTCTSGWVRVADRRNEIGTDVFDAYLKSKLSINVPNPGETYPNINAVWDAFQTALGVVTSLTVYEPVFKDYFMRAMEEFLADNVQHLEVRTELENNVSLS